MDFAYEAGRALQSAHAFCPKERTFPESMMWIADYFLRTYSPAALRTSQFRDWFIELPARSDLLLANFEAKKPDFEGPAKSAIAQVIADDVHVEPSRIMWAAISFAPKGLSHPERMRWSAEYFLAFYRPMASGPDEFNAWYSEFVRQVSLNGKQLHAALGGAGIQSLAEIPASSGNANPDCPACGGSGHVEDYLARIEALEVDEPTKDHHVRELINELRDVARTFHSMGQLRARIAGVVLGFFDQHPRSKEERTASKIEDTEVLAWLREGGWSLEGPGASGGHWRVRRTVAPLGRGDKPIEWTGRTAHQAMTKAREDISINPGS